MEIHINTGNGMDNREDLERWADGEIRQSLARFAEDVRRVEVLRARLRRLHEEHLRQPG